MSLVRSQQTSPVDIVASNARGKKLLPIILILLFSQLDDSYHHKRHCNSCRCSSVVVLLLSLLLIWPAVICLVTLFLLFLVPTSGLEAEAEGNGRGQAGYAIGQGWVGRVPKENSGSKQNSRSEHKTPQSEHKTPRRSDYYFRGYCFSSDSCVLGSCLLRFALSNAVGVLLAHDVLRPRFRQCTCHR